MSLVETRRVDGKVRHDHVASLGSIQALPTVADRVAFWSELQERMARLGTRLDGETQGKLLGAVHARVPMPTACEQRALQLENAEADHRDRQKGVAASAEEAIVKSQAAGADAAANAQPEISTYEERHPVGAEWVDRVFGPVRRIPKPTPWQIPRGNWSMKKEDKEKWLRGLLERCYGPESGPMRRQGLIPPVRGRQR